ncbi:MAG: hypothetical protein ACI9CQ_003675, partial [Saprospiraceae bacterium]
RTDKHGLISELMQIFKREFKYVHNITLGRDGKPEKQKHC